MSTRQAHQQKLERFLDLYAQCGNISRAAAGADVSRQAVYSALERMPSFAQRFAQAEAEAVERLEAIARDRAEAGSDLLIMFLLKAHKPEKYRERYAPVINAPITNYVIDLGIDDAHTIQEAERLNA